MKKKIVAFLIIWGGYAGSVVAADLGWTSFTPTTYDNSTYGLTDLKQPGSRLIYISTTGDDATAKLYFWDGTQIVDSTGNPTASDGTAYGTDPIKPGGSIKPFRRWAYVAPRRYAHQDIGTPWDGTEYLAPGELRASTRYGFPDWWMFHRGDVFDLSKDFLSFAQESDPGLTRVTGGSLAVSGGRSAIERQVVGAYGPLDTPRPRFINPIWGFISRWSKPDPRHIAYVSLHFDGHTPWGGRVSFQQQGPKAVDILLEDVWLDGAGITIQNTSMQLTLRRTLITDSHTDDHKHVQGLFFGGNRDAQLRVEESILMRNGFSNGDPKDPGNWPPAEDQYFDIYNRNMYISGECDSMNSGVFDTLSMLGASGDQFRCGLRVERSFFYQGYVQMGAHGGYPRTDGPSGSMLDNVLLRFKGSGTNDNRGHPGWGFSLTSGAYQVEVARNIVSGAQHPVNHYGLQISPLGWYCYSHVFNHPTQGNSIHDNIFDTAEAGAAISIVDGVKADKLNCSRWTYPGLVNNTVTANVLINGNGSASTYTPQPPARGTTHDTVFADNAVYNTRDEAAKTLGWPNPDRTLSTYMESMGYKVTSVDGFDEFFAEAIKQRKGYWRPEFTARAIVNYMREGFGMPLLKP
ncbi:hypothetical protein N8198_07725 [Gammaproteobacteria bacterium]|nr:hypothetical protein [Gammaproteobacteria bacterium]